MAYSMILKATFDARRAAGQLRRLRWKAARPRGMRPLAWRASRARTSTLGLASLVGFGAGAGVAYLFDPYAGRRRRSLVRDKVVHGVNRAGRGIDLALRDLAHRIRGLYAEGLSRLHPREVGDPVLLGRVRAAIGRVCRHPSAIEVQVVKGSVILSGQVLADEHEAVLARVGSVAGVKQVENRMEVHEHPGNVPSLQGNTPRREERPEPLQRNWAPSFRLLACLAGTAFLRGGLVAARRGGPGSRLAASLMGLGGLGLLARGISNMEMRRLLGIGAGRRAVDVRKTVNIDAPIEEVFAYFKHIENYPRIMSHVKEVTLLGNGQARWRVEGPAGVPVEFVTEVTRYVENDLLAWKTLPGEKIAHAGCVRFQKNPDGGTRLDIRMSYNPVAGVLGHAVASIFHKDPKHALDDDMIRFKSLLEQGKTSVHGHRVNRDEIAPAETAKKRRPEEALLTSEERPEGTPLH